MRIFLLTLLFIQTAVAFEEGLFPVTDDMPLAVSKAWNSVFMVSLKVKKGYNTGTASLIGYNDTGDSRDLFFLTNEHVIRDMCSADGKCKAINLLQEPSIVYPDKQFPILQNSGLQFSNVELMMSTPNPDMAILKTTISKKKLIQLPTPLVIAKNCDVPVRTKLFTIGFSYSLRRPSLPEWEKVQKRWSRGLSTGLMTTSPAFENGVNHFLATTLDALPGNSGGPILNEQGEIVSIVKASRSVGMSNYRYLGNERTLEPNAVGVECKYLHQAVDQE